MRLCAFRGLKRRFCAPVRLVDPLHMATVHQSRHTTPPKAVTFFFRVLRAAYECAARFHLQRTPADVGAWVTRALAGQIQNAPA